MPDLPHRTSPDLRVLHTLRCIGYVALPRIATAARLPQSDVESELIDLAVAGLVSYTPGDFGGWSLTGAGRAADAERIAEELETTGTELVVVGAFGAFLALNSEVLDLCTAWQLRDVDGVSRPNDHSDSAYDGRVLERFVDSHRRTEQHVLTKLLGALERFEPYQVRLADALERARNGSGEYLTDHLESYHAVWFQLHEDLLATLGRPRT